MAETPITSFGNHNEESEEQSQVDFVVDPISEEDLEDVSGGALERGCTNCSNGCSET